MKQDEVRTFEVSWFLSFLAAREASRHPPPVRDHIMLNSVSFSATAVGDYGRYTASLTLDRAGWKLREIQSTVRVSRPHHIVRRVQDLNDYLNEELSQQGSEPGTADKQVQWVQQPGRKGRASECNRTYPQALQAAASSQRAATLFSLKTYWGEPTPHTRSPWAYPRQADIKPKDTCGIFYSSISRK